MLRFLFLLYGFGTIILASRTYSGNPLFKSLGFEEDARIENGNVIFSDRPFRAKTAHRMCNTYVMRACNGFLNLLRSFSKQPPKISPITPSPIKWSIVGGRISHPHEYPHMALIGFGKYSEVKWLCGGSLISNKFVLSAAHCTATANDIAQWIRLGELDLLTTDDNAYTKDFSISQRIIHPEFRSPLLYNDIALFRIDGTIKFTSHIRPICLNIIHKTEISGVTALGWGSIGYGQRESSKLQSVNLDIEEYQKCETIYKGERLPYGVNTSTMICAGHAPGGKDTCQGDSGGPLQFLDRKSGCSRTYVQIGIISFGEGCAFPETPGIYTKLSFFIPWIESIVWS